MENIPNPWKVKIRYEFLHKNLMIMRKSGISNVESKVVRENYEPTPIYKSCETSSMDTTFWIWRKISWRPIFTLNVTMSILYQPQQGR